MKHIKFLSEVGKLKDVIRTGWKICCVRDPESVADHSFRVALMAMTYANELGLNENKCVKMALIHDIEEVYTMDIATRADKKNQSASDGEKKKKEEEAFKKLMLFCPNKKEITALWNEAHELKTEESKFVKDLDLIEMVLQALEYKKEKRNGEKLDEFFKTSEPRIKTSKGRELWDKILQEYTNQP